MAINKDSNAYTITFAVIMVIVVGAALAFAYAQLKPFQEENERQFKMQSMLKAIGVKVDNMKDAPDKFQESVVQTMLLDYEGNIIYTCDKAEDIGTKADSAFMCDVKKQYRDKNIDQKDRLYPLYIAETEEGKMFITPMVGNGLWGPIWGYVAFKDDMVTVAGATFDHKTETPGLGAEIKTDMYGDQYKGKKVSYSGGSFVTIKVIKGGKVPDKEGQDYVDGITGGTITSNGVNEMFERTVTVYSKYFTMLLAAG